MSGMRCTSIFGLRNFVVRSSTFIGAHEPFNGALQCKSPRIFADMKVVAVVFLATSILAKPETHAPDHRQVVLCAVNIVSRYVTAHQPLLVSLSNGDASDEYLALSSDLLEEVHALERWPVYIRCEGTHDSLLQGYTAIKYPSYIIIPQGVRFGVEAMMESIISQVQNLQAIEAGNPKGVYLVVLLSASNVNREMAVNLLAGLWEWKVLDVIVMVEVKNGVRDAETQVDLLSWFPFQSPKNCSRVTDVVLMDQWKNGHFVKNTDLFPQKITRNLNRCPLIASTMQWGTFVMRTNESNSEGTGSNVTYQDGLEVILYRNVLEAFNMTASIIEAAPGYGNVWGDYDPVANTYTGVIGDAKFGRSNISFCGLPKNYFFETIVDSTHSYVESGFNWYVQCARSRPRWQVFVRTFALSVWAALILAFVAFAIVMWVLAKFSDERQECTHYRSFVGTVQVLMAVFLNVSVNRMPSDIFLRSFFCLWVWSSFALTTVFQTHFTSFLVDPGLEKQVSDVEELLASNLALTFDDGYKDLFEGGDEQAELILSRRLPCPGFEACSRRTATVGDAATVLDFQNFDVYGRRFVDDYGDPLLCRLPEKISGYLITMFVQKGNPLFPPVNSVILRFVEAGLVDFWWSLIVERQKFTANLEIADEPITFFVFSLSHLYVAFTFLAIGYCLSVLVLLLEVLYSKYSDVTRLVDSSAPQVNVSSII